MTRLGAMALIGCSALILGGCASAPSGSGSGRSTRGSGGGGYYQNDGPPENENIDFSAIPDAVPHDEPLSAYGNPDSYEALGKTYYVLKSAAGFTQTGRASWYGRQFHGHRTSSGEPYNMYKMTAAHKRLPIPSYVQVTNLDNGRQVIVRVNDRGPFHDGRIIDLSYVAARRLGIVAHGSAPVRIKTITADSLRAENTQTPRSSVRRDRTPAVGVGERTVSAPPAPESSPTAHAVRVANSGSAPRASDALYLQTGAFGQVANARKMRARLIGAGFEHVIVVDPDSTTALYRVRVGPFDNERSRALTHRILVDRGFAVREVER